jgi:hypothetical protein
MLSSLFEHLLCAFTLSSSFRVEGIEPFLHEKNKVQRQGLEAIWYCGMVIRWPLTCPREMQREQGLGPEVPVRLIVEGSEEKWP